MPTFYTEARYRGARVAAVAPDYAEYVKFADTWLPARAGTDAALAMAMTLRHRQGILRRPPGAVLHGLRPAVHRPALSRWCSNPAAEIDTAGRFLRAADLGLDVNNAQWKTVLYRRGRGSFAVPNGSIGFRWNEEGRWNLKLEEEDQHDRPPAQFRGPARRMADGPLSDLREAGAGVKKGLVPCKTVIGPKGELRVTTVFDLMAAHLGVRRKTAPPAPDDCPAGYPTAMTIPSRSRPPGRRPSPAYRRPTPFGWRANSPKTPKRPAESP